MDATLATNEKPSRECRFESCHAVQFMSEKIKTLYAELEKHDPESPESYRIAGEIVEAIFDVEPEKAGSTVHAPGCTCGFCKIGATKF